MIAFGTTQLSQKKEEEMHYINYSLIISFFIYLSHPSFSSDDSLTDLFEQISLKASMPNKKYSQKPTINDLNNLEAAIGTKLPYCLSQFYLECGNRSFVIDEFPTIQNVSQPGNVYHSDLLSFITETPRLYGQCIPFCRDAGTYVYIDPNTQKVIYDSKEYDVFGKVQPQYFTDWLKSRLIRL